MIAVRTMEFDLLMSQLLIMDLKLFLTLRAPYHKDPHHWRHLLLIQGLYRLKVF